MPLPPPLQELGEEAFVHLPHAGPDDTAQETGGTEPHCLLFQRGHNKVPGEWYTKA